MLPEVIRPSTFTITPGVTTPVIEVGEDSVSSTIRMVIPFKVILLVSNSSTGPVTLNRPSGMTWGLVVWESSVVGVGISSC